jgi:hypothetical protein
VSNQILRPRLRLWTVQAVQMRSCTSSCACRRFTSLIFFSASTSNSEDRLHFILRERGLVLKPHEARKQAACTCTIVLLGPAPRCRSFGMKTRSGKNEASEICVDIDQLRRDLLFSSGAVQVGKSQSSSFQISLSIECAGKKKIRNHDTPVLVIV